MAFRIAERAHGAFQTPAVSEVMVHRGLFLLVRVPPVPFPASGLSSGAFLLEAFPVPHRQHPPAGIAEFVYHVRGAALVSDVQVHGPVTLLLAVLRHKGGLLPARKSKKTSPPRTLHPNLWHPIRFIIMLIVLVWTVYGVCYEPPTDISGVVWIAMLVAALVVSPLFPKSMSVAIIVIAYAGDLFTSYASSGNSLPTHLYAYGMLAYSTNVIIAAALFTYYIATILLISPPSPGTNPVSMISMYAMVLLLGRALSWSEKTTRKRFEAAQNKNRLQELESRARIADAIHDAVTGDLSAAAFVAQRHVDGVSGSPSVTAGSPVSAADAADAEDWRQINEYILFALTNVHRVIDELNMDATVLPGDADGWQTECIAGDRRACQ